MEKSKFFGGLEGCFTKSTKTTLHRLTPEENRAIAERAYLEKVVEGSKHNPEDIVGVALGVTHKGEGVQLRHVYLTERGMRENKDSRLSASYGQLLDNVVIKFGSFLKQCERGTFSFLADNYQGNPIEYVNLGGADNMARVLAIYSRGAGDSPDLEEESVKR